MSGQAAFSSCWVASVDRFCLGVVFCVARTKFQRGSSIMKTSGPRLTSDYGIMPDRLSSS